MHLAAAVVIFAASLVLLLLRPRGLPDWAAALGGGLVMIASGLLPVREALAQLGAGWNVFLFFFGLALSSAVAEQAGLFRTAAALAARTAGGSQRRLLIGLYLAGVLITAVLSNDATALLLTPVAFAAATRLGVDPRPYAFACALVANAASFLLPVANPANLLILGRAPLGLGTFLVHLLLPSVLALAVTLAGLLWRHGPPPLRELLMQALPPTPAARRVLQRERGYFRTNARRMQYPAFRRQGLPCGSGAVQSGAKHVVQLRMKRLGQRWSRPGAQAILALRAHLLSNRPLPIVA